jgi:hypothetical protein
VMITSPSHVTSSSPRLRLPAFGTHVCGVMCAADGRPAGQGTTLPTYDVRIAAFVKASANPGVRAWSPPV